MARNTATPGSLDSDESTQMALSLLAALTSAPGSRLPREAAATMLGVSDAQLDGLIDLLLSVSDDRTGARVAIIQADGELALMGTAGRFAPLRFTGEEALAITQVLDRFQIPHDIRMRVHGALDPLVAPCDDELLSGDPLFGGFYQTISEAITIGARMRISYRSHRDKADVERTVDPGFFMTSQDAAYLVAWDVEKDAQRTYRLDRISGAKLTDESVARHEFERVATGESLRAGGEAVSLLFKSAEAFERCGWAGLERGAADIQADGTVRTVLNCTSSTWLFDQVLAAGGEIAILAPQKLRRELVSYARGL